MEEDFLEGEHAEYVKEELENEELEEERVEMEVKREVKEADHDEEKPASQPKSSVGKELHNSSVIEHNIFHLVCSFVILSPLTISSNDHPPSCSRCSQHHLGKILKTSFKREVDLNFQADLKKNCNKPLVHSADDLARSILPPLQYHPLMPHRPCQP